MPPLDTFAKKCKSVGPLWTHSCFPFVAFNFQTERQLRGYKGIITQVMQKFILIQNLPQSITNYVNSPIPKEFCKQMMSIDIDLFPKLHKYSSLHLY